MERILPDYLMMGVSEERFWDGCPADLKPYVTAFNNAQKAKDREMWQMGLYIENAVYVAAAKAVHGKKASNVKYMEKPLMEQEQNKHGEKLTQAQIEQQRKNLLYSLQLAQISFENKHGTERTQPE